MPELLQLHFCVLHVFLPLQEHLMTFSRTSGATAMLGGGALLQLEILLISTADPITNIVNLRPALDRRLFADTVATYQP